MALPLCHETGNNAPKHVKMAQDADSGCQLMTPRKFRPLALLALSAVLIESPVFIGTARAGMLGQIRESIASLWGKKADHEQAAGAALNRATVTGHQARWVHEQLEDTQRVLLQANDEYANYWGQMIETQRQLQATIGQIKLVQARFQEHQLLFGERLASMQRHGEPSYLEVLFGSQTLSDLTRRATFYSVITEYDARLAADLRADQGELQIEENLEARQWSERRRLQLAANRERVRIYNAEQLQAWQWQRLNSSQSELVAYAQAQEQSSQDISSMINDLESRRAQIIAGYDAQVESERQEQAGNVAGDQTAPAYRERVAPARGFGRNSARGLPPHWAARIPTSAGGPLYAPRVGLVDSRYVMPDSQQLSPMSIAALRGQTAPAAAPEVSVQGEAWLMPARGRLSSRFGMRYHPILHRMKLHTGDDIAAPYGEPFCAARSGRVLWAGWKTAYGNTIIIDIGNGMTVLYGHASKLGVCAGQPVRAGEYIGNVGSTGWSTGPHLHFEVRRNGMPIDPTCYLVGH